MDDDEIVIGVNNGNSPKRIKKAKEKKTRKTKKVNQKKQSNKPAIKTGIKSKNKKSIGSRNRINTALLKSSQNNKEKVKEEIKNSKPKIITALVIIIAFTILLLSSGLFNIKNINISGNQRLSSDTIISLSQIKTNTNIFGFNKISAINRIKGNAYVEDVKISRKLPKTVDITIVEREPTYMLQYADSYVYINNQGYMLEISNEKLNIPILVGFTTDLSNIKVGNRINNSDLEKMTLIIKILIIAKSNDLDGLITKIDVSNPKNYIMVLEGEGKTVNLGDCSDSDLNTKLLYLKSIVDASGGRAGEVFLNVDLNNQNVYVRWNTD